MQNIGENCIRCNHNITIYNLENCANLCYSLALLKGNVSHATEDCKNNLNKLIVSSVCTTTIKKLSESPVVDSEFKCIVSLNRGKNSFILEYCSCKFEFNLFYVPRKTNLSVIPVYIICQGHDGRFQAPSGMDNSIKSACERIAIGAKLIQSLTAEKMYEAQMGRKTFQLENDIDSSAPDCVTFHSQLPYEKARKMKPQELWEHFGRELMMSSLGSNNRKFLAFLSCTYYNPATIADELRSHSDILSVTEAHVALGGGGLAIFGTACLYTWAKTIDDIIPSFLNKTKVDSHYFMDDSCYRGTYGGCFSTTLGSVTHELGHTFDLGHSLNGIMGRGFDDIDLVFTVQKSDDVRKNYNSENGNILKAVCRDVPVHSTVCFSKELNLSYTISSPMKLPNSKPKTTNIPAAGDDGNNQCMNKAITDLNKNKTDSSVVRKQSLDNNIPLDAIKPTFRSNDGIFWSRSCAIILAYHRWFNDITEICGKIILDTSKCLLRSTAGLRVVEIRDESGLVVNHWEFLDPVLKYNFTLPADIVKRSHMLVAEDSEGNILKECLRPV